MIFTKSSEKISKYDEPRKIIIFNGKFVDFILFFCKITAFCSTEVSLPK